MTQSITVKIPDVDRTKLGAPHLVLLSLLVSGKKERLSKVHLQPLLQSKKWGSCSQVAAVLEAAGFIAIDHAYVTSTFNSQGIGVSKGYQLTAAARKLPVVAVEITDAGQVRRFGKYLQAVEQRALVQGECDVVRGLRRALEATTVNGEKVNTRVSVDRDGRFYSAVTNLPREHRANLRVHGEPVVGIDTRASNFLSVICVYSEAVSGTGRNVMGATPPSNVVTLERLYRSNQRPVSKDALNIWFCDHSLKSPQSREVDAWFQQNAPDFLAWFRKQRRTFKAALYKRWVRHERTRMQAIYRALLERDLLQYVLDIHDGFQVAASKAPEVLAVAQEALDRVTGGLGVLTPETPLTPSPAQTATDVPPARQTVLQNVLRAPRRVICDAPWITEPDVPIHLCINAIDGPD